MSKRRPWKALSYANVTATLALFLALGGAGAIAAGQLAPKSVGERQLRPGAVTADKIRKHAVTAPKIKELAVKSGKIANASITGSKLAGDAVGVEKIANGAVTGPKIAANAVTGDKVDEASLGEVPFAAAANSAAFAASANPAAFVKVDQEGNVDTALSKGIGPGNVSKGSGINIYCISVPGFSPRGAQVTPEYNNSSGSGLIAQVTIGGTGSCPSPQVEVRTWSAGVAVKAGFYLVAYQ